MPYTTLSLTIDGRLARLTLERPERLNAIDREMPRELAAAVAAANAAADVRVIVLAGAGRAFCAGYDLEWGTRVEAQADAATTAWDPMRDLAMMSENVGCFMSLWRSRKPVIAKVHGWCVGGGTDLALRRMAQLPANQLAMMKLLVNQAYENMGLASTQLLGTLLDGVARHTPEGLAWRTDALERGVKAALTARDGPFGDYGARPRKP